MNKIARTDTVSRASGIAARAVGDEAVIVQPGDGIVTVLNSVGARLWELLEAPRSVQELTRIIAGDFDVSEDRALADIQEFLDDLIGKGLVCFASGNKKRADS